MGDFFIGSLRDYVRHVNYTIMYLFRLLHDKGIRKIGKNNLICHTSSRLLNHRALSSSLATLKEKRNTIIYYILLYTIVLDIKNSYKHDSL